ncbi:MAG TPA: hypothetical protein VKM94_16395 [Blastocatellia bacterium]|nr:hypothetical protein [Blastocatellia bacterium]
MTEDTNHLKQPKSSKVVAAVLFLLCAIPGLVIFLTFSTMLFAAYYDPAPNLPGPIVSAATAVIGALLMLIGVGQWRNWAYLFVFFSIPISLFICFFLIDPNASSGKLAPALFCRLGCVCNLLCGSAILSTSQRLNRFARKDSPVASEKQLIKVSHGLIAFD